MKYIISSIVLAWIVYSVHVIFFKEFPPRVIELTSDDPVIIQPNDWESTIQPI